MPYSQADVDALDAEIATIRSVKSTTFSDQSTTFRDLDELLKLRALMLGEVNAGSGGSRTRYAATSKGL